MYGEIIFYVLLLMVSFLYASVGHGGASGYLALMAFFSYPVDLMRPTALLLNIFVSAIAFWQYYRGGYFRWKLFLPFAVASVPAAFLGGGMTLDDHIYKKVLAVLLLLPAIRLLGFGIKDGSISEQNVFVSVMSGSAIGLISGMIGIGGGIILSPLILMLHWADMKQTAAVSALFIFVNSIAGLSGVFANGTDFTSSAIVMTCVAVVGGWGGSYLGANKFNTDMLKKLLSLVLIIAAAKLFYT
ncbi:MAG: sulfite exporter TauE/SafE family protein [Saprospiraceae bacterium]|nr:sulfite exporter TauE/SafE family protein [Saprospiraceae bacterium]